MQAPQKKEVQEETVIFMQHAGSYDEIGRVYRELYEWARENNVKVKGNGFTIFIRPPNEVDSASALFEVCIPVESAPSTDARVEVKSVPRCTVAYVTVKGPYDQVPAHYTEMLAWLSAEGWEIAGAPREVYIRRPDSHGRGDPEEFLTEIQFPIR